MQLNNFSNGQLWAIRPDSLETMIQSMADQVGDKDFLAQLANFTPEPESSFDFLLRDGVAIIPVTGPISPRGSFWSMIYGGTPLSVLQRILADAIDDPDVSAIVLNFDSPGGMVSGTEAFSQIVAEVKAIKPVVAFAGGDMCSAAYWIGSAANKVIAEKTADIGSIGVASIHTDRSEAYKEIGFKKTILTAGKYKSVGNDVEPLSDLARETIQGHLDYTYTIFVNTVAANRNTDPATVLKDMADGRIFIGQQAKDAGLVDEIGSLETAIQAAADLVDDADSQTVYTYQLANPKIKERTTMKKDIKEIVTVDDLTAALPDLAQQLIAQGAAGVNTDEIINTAKTEAQALILDLVSAHFGKDAGDKFKALVDTGVTVKQLAAITGLQPAAGQQAGADDSNAQVLAALQASGADNPGAGGDGGQPAGFMVLVDQYRADHKCSLSQAMSAVRESNPEAHQTYLKGFNK